MSESKESNHLSFDCMVDGKRCTRCCEAIHMPKNAGLTIVRRNNKRVFKSDWVLLKHWKQITKRQAKKINPYMFGEGWTKNQKKFVNQGAIFFKCTALVDGKCTVYYHRPFACRDFDGYGMYAYECAMEAWEKRQLAEQEAEIDLKVKAA